MNRSTSLIENACVELFTTQLQEQFNQAALCLPTDILQLLQAMRSTLLAIKSYIPALSADAIVCLSLSLLKNRWTLVAKHVIFQIIT